MKINYYKSLRTISIYLIMWTVTWTGMLGFFQGAWPSIACEGYRRDLAFSMGMAAIPVVSWVAVPFMTGFYEHGFQVFRKPECK